MQKKKAEASVAHVAQTGSAVKPDSMPDDQTSQRKQSEHGQRSQQEAVQHAEANLIDQATVQKADSFIGEAQEGSNAEQVAPPRVKKQKVMNDDEKQQIEDFIQIDPQGPFLSNCKFVEKQDNL